MVEQQETKSMEDSSGLLQPDYEPNDNDVLCGRGNQSFQHAGNRKFRSMVDERVERYAAAKVRREKSAIVKEVIGLVHAAGGSFIRFDLETLRWRTVGKVTIGEKVSSRFRNSLFERYPSSSTAKNQRFKERTRQIRQEKHQANESRWRQELGASALCAASTNQQSSNAFHAATAAAAPGPLRVRTAVGQPSHVTPPNLPPAQSPPGCHHQSGISRTTNHSVLRYQQLRALALRQKAQPAPTEVRHQQSSAPAPRPLQSASVSLEDEGASPQNQQCPLDVSEPPPRLDIAAANPLYHSAGTHSFIQQQQHHSHPPLPLHQKQRVVVLPPVYIVCPGPTPAERGAPPIQTPVPGPFLHGNIRRLTGPL